MILHITNGDSAAGQLQQLYPHDTILPWRDSLTDGPVPPGLTPEELSAVRAGFLAAWSKRPLAAVRADLQERDGLVTRHAEFAGTVLWFEHDLHDQLQLLQVLDRFRGRGANVTLAQSPDYLGEMGLAAVAELFSSRLPVSQGQFELAAAAWRAFRSPDPRALEAFLDNDDELPYLAGAIERLCEEFPWVEDGLTRTERTIARLRTGGIVEPAQLFAAFNRTEEPRWMGDASFYRILDGARDRAPGWLWDATRRRLARRPS